MGLRIEWNGTVVKEIRSMIWNELDGDLTLMYRDMYS
jgi:hypothetical protein